MAVIEFINRKNLTLMGMKKNLAYITKDQKTVNGKYVYGHNCDAANAYEDFCLTKQMFGKLSGRQHIHFTQSFRGQEASAELAHQIGKELLAHPLFKNFQVVMATHTDTHNIHNHFVVNTVNVEDGKKWQLSEEDLEELKDFSDEICGKYSLEVVDKTYQTTKEYIPLGKESKKKEMYAAVLAASRQAKSSEEFAALLSESGKTAHWDGNEQFKQNKLLEAILNACKYHAKDETEFIGDCKHYGVKTTWKVKAVIETEDGGEKKQEEKVFESPAAYQKAVEELKENESIAQVMDEIYYEYEGKTYTPAHFYKNLRWEGKALRDAFQVNLIKDKVKPLPAKETLKALKGSEEYKNLSRLIRTARQCSLSLKDFIAKMERLDVTVTWSEKRKYITFQPLGGRKYRNSRFFPPSSFTKEAFLEVFAFNQKMKKLIVDHPVTSYEELKALAAAGSLPDLRLEEKTSRVYLKMEVLEEKLAGEKDKRMPDTPKEVQKVVRESYFDEEAINRFLADEARQTIILPEKAEILKEDKKSFLLLESAEGYLFSASSLSKKFTKENLGQRFLNNAFWEISQEAVRDIRTVLWLSRSWQDFAEKLRAAGYDIALRPLLESDRGKCAMKEGKKTSEETVIFKAKDGISFEGEYAAKSFTIERITEQLEKNQNRMAAWEREQKFDLFLRGLFFVGDREETGEKPAGKPLVKKKLEGQALKDYLKEKGYEL